MYWLRHFSGQPPAAYHLPPKLLAWSGVSTSMLFTWLVRKWLCPIQTKYLKIGNKEQGDSGKWWACRPFILFLCPRSAPHIPYNVQQLHFPKSFLLTNTVMLRLSQTSFGKVCFRFVDSLFEKCWDNFTFGFHSLPDVKSQACNKCWNASLWLYNLINCIMII